MKPVSLEMELPQVDQLADLLRDLGDLVVPDREHPEVPQVRDLGREELKVVVTVTKKPIFSPRSITNKHSFLPEIEGPEGEHEEKVLWKGLFAQVVVGEVEDLQRGEGAEPAGKVGQSVHAEVQNSAGQKDQVSGTMTLMRS